MQSATPHPYRARAEPLRDEEALALAVLAARARRVRRAVRLRILAAGLLLFPLFVLAQELAAYAGRKAVAARSRAWIAEIAVTPGVSASLLEAFVRVL